MSKYIMTKIEGTLLKYFLDEPLVSENVNIYEFILDPSNFINDETNEWSDKYYHSAVKPTRMVYFQNTQNSNKDAATLELREINGKQYYYGGKVPSSQLIPDGRLQITIQLQDTETGSVRTTVAMNNPPKVYRGGTVGVTVDLATENFLVTLINNLARGNRNELLIKKTNTDYDFSWGKEVPGTIIYGGSGNVSGEPGHKILTIDNLTEAAKDRLNIEQVATVTSYQILESDQLKQEAIQYIIKTQSPIEFGGIQFSDGDSIISDGTAWQKISKSNGKAQTAERLETPRKIGVEGTETSQIPSFDGSLDITLPKIEASNIVNGAIGTNQLGDKSITAGKLAEGLVVPKATEASTASKCTGNANTATTLQNSRTFSIGSGTEVFFNGSSNVNLSLPTQISTDEITISKLIVNSSMYGTSEPPAQATQGQLYFKILG